MDQSNPAPSAVFDTNICLDFFVFKDPVSCRVLDAIHAHKLTAITREDCREEFLRVLAYPKLGLTENEQEKAIALFDQSITVLAPPAKDRTLLPLCTDSDDQKFLEMAHDANASLLFTKDKALLKLARYNRKKGLFRIVTPTAWLSENRMDDSPE